MERIAYFNGQIGDYDEMKLPLGDRSIFFGDAVYDAVLVLDRKPFALGLHLDRLYRSCALTEIKFEMPRAELESEIAKLLALAPMGEVLFYIQVTRGAAPRKHEYPENAKPNLIMFVTPTKVPPRDKRATLVSVEDLRFQFCNIKTTNLMPNVFAAQKAKSMGADEVLFHRGERVTEAAHSSLLMLKDGVMVFPPLDELVLPGITRAVIYDLCKENGIPVETRIFTVDEFIDADELFVCSTTKNVICVFEIDGKPVGGKNRELAVRVQNLLLEKVYSETGVNLLDK